MATGLATMGRPKKKPDAATPAAKTDERIAVIHLKGTPAYATWLEGVHRKTHIPKATIFRLALAEWAERHGHETPPEA